MKEITMSITKVNDYNYRITYINPNDGKEGQRVDMEISIDDLFNCFPEKNRMENLAIEVLKQYIYHADNNNE